MNTIPTPPPAQPKQSAKKIGMIVGGILLLGVLMVWGIVSVVSGRDWALGVGSQQSAAKLDTVQRAVSATSDVLFVNVRNANTSGTPFGHSIRVTVFFDEAKVAPDDEVAVRRLTRAAEDAIYRTKVADEYTVFYIPAKASESFDSDSLLRTADAVVTNKFKVNK